MLYCQPGHSNGSFYHTIENLVQTNEIDILLGDFNIDALDCGIQDLQRRLQNYRLVVNKPTHISGSFLDQVYVRDSFLNDKTIDVIVTNILLTDHDAVQFNKCFKWVDSKYVYIYTLYEKRFKWIVRVELLYMKEFNFIKYRRFFSSFFFNASTMYIIVLWIFKMDVDIPDTSDIPSSEEETLLAEIEIGGNDTQA